MSRTSLIRKLAFTFAIIGLLTAPNAESCSRILLSKNPKHITSSRSVDWHEPLGAQLLIYPRGMKVNGEAGENSATWTSKYGSLLNVGNKYANVGTEGVNEKGFAIHTLYLDKTEYEPRDSRPGVSYIHFCRYLLDNSATVKEALALMKTVQLVPVKINGKIMPLHWAMEDPSGDSAIVEFIDGNLVVHHGKEYTIMTNEPSYDVHVENLKKYEGFGGDEKNLPGGIEAWERFIRAAYYLKHLPTPKTEEESAAFALQLIRNVSVPFGAPYGTGAGAGIYPTWWVSATDISNRVYYFNSTFSANVIWVDLKGLDFSAGNPVRKLADPRNPAYVGDVSRAFKEVSE